MRRARLTAVALPALGLAVAAALLLTPLPRGWTAGWRATLLDLGHVPLFAALVLALRPRLGLRRAVLVAVAVAGAAELVQGWVGRNGGWADFLHGSLGALAAAAAVRARQAWPDRRRAAAYGLAALALPVWPVLVTGPTLLDAYEGSRYFPELAAFRTDRELGRWECEQAELTRVPTPEGWAGQLDFLPGPGDYSGAALRPVVGDARGYRWLCCMFDVEGEEFEVVLSVRTGVPGGRTTTHYQTGRTCGHGPHLIRLDLPAVAAANRPVPLDLSDVRAVQLFTVRSGVPRVVRVRRVWLEP